MTTFSRYDITTEGSQFIPNVVADNGFQANGVLYGHNDPWFWAVVDSTRHPLFVWQKSGSADYAASAETLGAVVFSNGPMMARFTAGGALVRIAVWTALGAGLGALIGWAFGNPRVGAAGGAAGAGVAAYRTTWQGWEPLGPVHGRHQGIDDRGKRPSDPWLGMLGRKSRDPMMAVPFSDYVTRQGSNDAGLDEVIAGLIPLVQGGAAMSSLAGAANYNQGYADLTRRFVAGIVGWGLVPLAPALWKTGDEMSRGVLVAAGTNRRGFNGLLAGIFVSIGVSDAVAMDGSNSVMLGEGVSQFWSTPPDFKQRIQRYGFYCGTT